MAWWTNKDGIGIKNGPNTRWLNVENLEVFDSIFEETRRQVADQLDKVRFEAFEKCGYSRDFVLDPGNRNRIECAGIVGLPDVELWTVDGVPKFEITKIVGWSGLVMKLDATVRYL